LARRLKLRDAATARTRHPNNASIVPLVPEPARPESVVAFLHQ